jgi:hypothetical protein
MTPIRCEQCGRLLFDANADGLLEHAGGLLRHVDGVCVCGHGYHWSVCERQLERILERYLDKKHELEVLMK